MRRHADGTPTHDDRNGDCQCQRRGCDSEQIYPGITVREMNQPNFDWNRTYRTEDTTK